MIHFSPKKRLVQKTFSSIARNLVFTMLLLVLIVERKPLGLVLSFEVVTWCIENESLSHYIKVQKMKESLKPVTR